MAQQRESPLYTFIPLVDFFHLFFFKFLFFKTDCNYNTCSKAKLLTFSKLQVNVSVTQYYSSS